MARQVFEQISLRRTQLQLMYSRLSKSTQDQIPYSTVSITTPILQKTEGQIEEAANLLDRVGRQRWSYRTRAKFVYLKNEVDSLLKGIESSFQTLVSATLDLNLDVSLHKLK